MPKEKRPEIAIGDEVYLRIPIKTHILTPQDDPLQVVKTYALSQLQTGDILFIAETPLAIMQNRHRHISTIKVSFWAKLLARFVTKSPYGVGVRSPRAMQVAIEEVGLARILLATLASAWGKLVLRRRGDFYRVAGLAVKSIDAEHTMGIKEYYDYVIPGPVRCDEICASIKAETGCDACVVDVNDIQVPEILGSSFSGNRELEEMVVKALADNPLGQGAQCTPMGILRKVSQTAS